METAELQNQTISPNTQLLTSTPNTDSTRPDQTLSHSRTGSVTSHPQTKPEKEKEKQQDKDKDTKKPSKPKVVLNISDTRYDVVRYVGKKLLGYKVTKDLEVEWDVFWTDNAVQPEQLARMQPFQKINHFPGMYSLARKNHLGRNLMRMKKAFPENFKFFPQTYLLPAEYTDFKMQFGNRNKSKTFIVKPEASCQGRGIFLTRTYEDVQPGEHYVVQRYLHKPFLLDGLKFDMRIYVLLAGCDPLRIYLFDDGLGRFATEEYIAPTAENLENMCMHLTNYAINKDNPNFVFNESADKNDVGHKRSLKAVMKTLEEKGYDVKTLWNDIKKIIIKTLCSVQPILAHSYKSCQPDEPNNNMCFEILGIDIMLDHKLKPWLLEVNHTPSFTTDTPLDKTIKQNVIRDALVLMNVSAENRIKYKNKKKAELQQRVLQGKRPKISLEERQANAAKAQLERDEWESQHLGGFEKIYPFDDPSKAEEDYSEFIRAAQQWWEEWTGTSAKKVVKKPAPEKEGRLPPMNFGQVNSNAPAGVNGNVRAKEIQTVYSQKMKLGSQTLKNPSSSQQKTRVNTASVSASTTTQGGESAIDKSATKAQTVGNNDELQPWSMKSPLEQYRVVGEDETDYFEEMMVPVREEEEDAGNDEPVATGAQFDLKFPGRAALTDSVQKNSTLSNLSTNSEIANLSNTQADSSKISTFRIKRMSGIEGVKESPCRPIQSRADKENAKSALLKKPESRMGLQSRNQPSQSASNSMYLTKAPEKLAEVYGVRETTSDKTVRATKTALKLGNGVFGSLANTLNTEEHATVATVNEFETEKKVKSSGYGSLGRTNSHKNSLRAPSKKGTYLSVQQPKDATFLVPKMFELNIQGLKQEQTKETTVYTGLKSFGRSLSKGVIQPGNQSGAINACFQDSQFNVQKTIM